jgi:undecaprenyl-diphosphatase
LPDLLKAIVLGIVEGVTEFLPISSTGHLLLCERWMGIDLERDRLWKTFAIFIQIGAIAAVAVYFRRRILDLLLGRAEGKRTPLEISAAAGVGAAARGATTAAAASPGVGPGASGPMSAANAVGTRHDPAGGFVVDYQSALDEDLITPAQRVNAILMILLATAPVLIVAFLIKETTEDAQGRDWIDRNMSSPWVVPAALLIGGVAMLVIEWLPTSVTTRRIERITWKQALGIGVAQILAAVFPGTSRSAATIMGGMLAGLSRDAAAEFSFFLAIPAMSAACGYALLKWMKDASPTTAEMLLMLIGTLVSFLVAWAVIAAFMRYIRRRNFIPFAVYRIALGLVVLLIAWRNG